MKKLFWIKLQSLFAVADPEEFSIQPLFHSSCSRQFPCEEVINVITCFCARIFCMSFFPPFSSGLCQPDDSELTALFSALKDLGCIVVFCSLGKKGINSRQNFIFLELLKWKKKGMAEKMTHQRDACKHPSLAVYFPLVQL